MGNNSTIADDYSLSRVPLSARLPMRDILIIRLGGFATLSQFMLGAALGYGMTFWQAFWATMLGSLVLQVVSLLLGLAGAREGLSTSLLSRWAGFGRYGSSIISGVMAICLIGWFGVQNSVFANGLVEATDGKLGFMLAATITGLAVTVLVIFGFKILSATAKIAVPAFLFVVAFGIYDVLSDHSIFRLMGTPAPGEALSMGVAATMVAGSFMIGAIITPDFSRYNKNGKDVFWMTIVGIFVGELGINLIAVLMAHAAQTSDVVSIMLQTSGWLGAAVVIFSTVKVNNINLYSSSLSFTNIIDSIFKVKVNRGIVTLIIGIIGTTLSILGILDKFVDFLILLGVMIPPIAGIMVVDYFILKTHRKALDESREKGELPGEPEKLNPVTIVAWAAGFAGGYFISVGIPSLTSLLISGLAYYLGMMCMKAIRKNEVAEEKITL
ncbi:cytosine permease [Bacillus sp. V5-8f]|uniref:purine-cytosine permease family protein n=1 Tax=Bacillus sp. V5-8f TaxID=2053044 RepID=UPI000C755EFF|nr:cytosine permease [Bacillus sp. V5-8f]PLT32782.1 cytosine permease [Bacillus sp. V5-8f]